MRPTGRLASRSLMAPRSPVGSWIGPPATTLPRISLVVPVIRPSSVLSTLRRRVRRTHEDVRMKEWDSQPPRSEHAVNRKMDFGRYVIVALSTSAIRKVRRDFSCVVQSVDTSIDFCVIFVNRITKVVRAPPPFPTPEELL